ncbi:MULTISPECIES: cytochrome c-type biogenesis protein [unclassified Roseitalea]|uniref:cytochrome c-type biogenesis protein n=1 Tax=unclassified Roseitalea TaxID=2639107 RepID=UPI00273D5158|nr:MULTISPECIES: cytochrome c-type biogenesis protein [unclassified Roseitalea]
MTRWLAALVLLTAMAMPAMAVNPDEILDDPALEERARDISAGLRCMVCQNQSIDDSDAELARDLRVLVRDRLVAGDSNEEVVAYVVDRYGEFVLLRPAFSARNALLWATPAIILILGGTAAFAFSRRQSRSQLGEALTEDEQARVAKILDEGEERQA